MTPSTPPNAKAFSLPPRYRDDAEELLAFLRPYTARAYYVGGCVRDALLGISSSDFDIEVYDLGAERFAAAMERLGAVRVGRSFHVYKWRSFDLALPRTETRTGSGHTDFDTEVAQDERTASFRRDFTVNALMVHCFKGDLLDFWGGAADLALGTLRLIDPEKFAEDSLRVLRAMQFAARFGFRIDETTIRICRGLDLSKLSGERIFGEFYKMFTAKDPVRGLYYAGRLGVTEQLFGLTLSRGELVAAAREFRRIAPHMGQRGEYGLLYALYQALHLPPKRLLDTLHAPSRYRKSLQRQKRRPTHVTDRFLKALSLRYPLAEWLGMTDELVRRAKRLGIYDASFDHGVDIQEVIAEGYEKEQIRIEHTRRVSRILRKEAR